MNSTDPHVQAILAQINAAGGPGMVDILSFDTTPHTVKFLQGLIEKIQNGTVTVVKSNFVFDSSDPNLEKYNFIVRGTTYR